MMNYKQKLGYFALGGLIGVVGMVIGMYISQSTTTQVTSQNASFGVITCTGLTVVNQDGKESIRLSTDGWGGQVNITDHSEEKPVNPDDIDSIFQRCVILGIDKEGGFVHVNGGGFPSNHVHLNINEHGGYVNVGRKKSLGHIRLDFNEHGGQFEIGEFMFPIIRLFTDEHGGEANLAASDEGKAQIRLGIDEDGSFMGLGGENMRGVTLESEKGVGVHGDDGKTLAGIGIGESSGFLIVVGKDNKGTASMAVTEHGGHVEVSGDGIPGIEMTCSEYGGRLNVFGKTNLTNRAAIAVNEYGNGTINTWDKNGYRTSP